MIPDFQTIMLPILQILNDDSEHSLRDVIQQISDRYNLTEDERTELLPSGNQPIIDNRVGWARTYLKKAGLLENPQRGLIKISPQGKSVLASNPSRIDIKFLKELPGFNEWVASYANKGEEIVDSVEEITTNQTPEELLDYSHLKLRQELAIELLEKIKDNTPAFFEQLVVDLLIKMGYGGSRKEAGQVIGRSGDGGVDGIIKEDKLGLETIYIQAKKYDGSVPISHIRDFAGSLLFKKARKGIFITTSYCPDSAYDFVASIEPRIIIINGKELAELMIEHNVGVSIKKTYEVKRLDLEYFEGE